MRKSVKLTAAISGLGVIGSLMLGTWSDNYWPLWVSIPLVLIFESCTVWFGIAAGVSLFDHLQSDSETEVGLKK